MKKLQSSSIKSKKNIVIRILSWIWEGILWCLNECWYYFKLFVRTFIKPFFFADGKFCPPYFWITLLLLYIIRFLDKRLDVNEMARLKITDSLILGLLAFVFSWLGVYTWYRLKKNNTNNNNM